MLRNALLIGMLVALGGCSTSEGSPSSTPPSPEQNRTPAPQKQPSGACDTLDRAACISSLRCTLHNIKASQYECRPSQGPCEVGLIQTDRRACEARAGCLFENANCYCPFPGYGKTKVPDIQPDSGVVGACGCGGGPPSRCKSAP